MRNNRNNYGKMYDKKPVVTGEITEAEVDNVVEDHGPVEPDILKGVVANCELLNVREEPTRDSAAIAVIKKGDELMVDRIFNENGFCKVITESSVEGYCVRKFIAIEA